MLEEKFFCLLLGFFLLIVLLRWPCFEKFTNFMKISSISNQNCNKSCARCKISTTNRLSKDRITKVRYN